MAEQWQLSCAYLYNGNNMGMKAVEVWLLLQWEQHNGVFSSYVVATFATTTAQWEW